MVSSADLIFTCVSPKGSVAACISGVGCSPDSSTKKDSSPLRPASLPDGSRLVPTSVAAILFSSATLWRRRHAASASKMKNARMSAAGTHQWAATQSIQDPDSAGVTPGFFCATGGVTGVGVEVSAGGGTGVAVGAGVVATGG